MGNAGHNRELSDDITDDLKKYKITFAFTIEAKNGDDAIDDFISRMYDNEHTSPDTDDFIATEIEK